MKATRTIIAALVLAVAAACSTNPVAPDTEANMGTMGSGHQVAPTDGPSYGTMGSGH